MNRLNIHGYTEVPVLSSRHVQKTYILKKQPLTGKVLKKITAVDDVNINVYKGTTLGLVGESGSGKSTIGEIMGGLQKSTCGYVFYNEKNIATLSREEYLDYRGNVQFIFQDPKGSTSPYLSVEDIVSEPLKVLKICNDKRENKRIVDKMLDFVGLESSYAKRYSWELSGGQCQRVAIARALIVKPSVIICDEPVSALDVSVQAQILNLLKDLQDELGLAYLFISHDLGVVHYMANDIAVMKKGKIVEAGKAEDVLSNPQHEYTRELIEASSFFNHPNKVSHPL